MFGDLREFLQLFERLVRALERLADAHERRNPNV